METCMQENRTSRLVPTAIQSLNGNADLFVGAKALCVARSKNGPPRAPWLNTRRTKKEEKQSPHNQLVTQQSNTANKIALIVGDSRFDCSQLAPLYVSAGRVACD